MIKLAKKDILGIQEMTTEEITLILDTAESFLEISTREIKKVPTLRGKSVINLFYEASTRTRTSFELAGKRLSADTINISASTSSVVKGETLIDTARNLEAMNPDIIVIRHSAAGAPHLLAGLVRQSIINAGDGAHEHPSQALLDMLTIREKKGKIAGLKVAIIGDIAHSRVARSNIYGLSKMGAEVVVAGPPTMLPREVDKLGVRAYTKLEEAVTDADVVMMLRIQLERERQNIFPSLREYARHYCLNRLNLGLAKKDVIVMHPGPINRGVEISPDIADDPSCSVILNQVNNGVAVRMALLYLLTGGGQ
ncbi:MAG TPA: aspartate carbamoyltransferase catalytic subunit [Smithellaceae bacterium]|jgi:aspartate carbamoyltransferase catalytic subunit|nr:aspartate carbamoyltransferase catalytic subunit [Syntrophaceae bacterium]HOE79611.1 aspartate carbamoyltransferase catalytic subunit [Smithellaceae bacterium]HPL96301.1 aspartate carbamoyltransferase catalytic subunit [Smithellaceae bacterium]HPV48574.1 aspartate carbamoyltransferase catalytic subunit [Smithellaceae bacterium]HQF85085.1 aspartate carbamoyltransferase catalytic subunit [Smithellaceae bacterium]